MSGLPWVRFFPSDWLAGTRGMSAAETGIYITLVATMYERREPVPEHHERLARLCGTTVAAFARALDSLVAEGKVIRSEEGLSPGGSEVQPPALRRTFPANWAAIRQMVIERDGPVCRYCGGTPDKLQIDHILPVSRGGTDALENLAVACLPCNASKKDRFLEDWMEMAE